MNDIENIVHLAFGVRRKTECDSQIPDRERKTIIGAPFKVYAVSYVNGHNIAKPPFYRVTIEKDDLCRTMLEEGSAEYNKILKWAGRGSTPGTKSRAVERRVLNGYVPGCMINAGQAKDLISDSEMYCLLMRYSELKKED